MRLYISVCLFHSVFPLFADAVNVFLQKLFLVVPQDNPDELDWD